MLEKGILLPGVGNARQLGGYRIKDKRIRDGVLIRSAALNQATPEAVETLRNKYRIQSVIDFRMSSERQFQPDPAIPGSDNTHLPVLEMEDAMKGANPKMVEQYTASKTDRMALFNVAYESGMLRKYRIIEWFRSGGNFSRLRTARIEGYLAGNRDSCRQQAADIHPLMGREHCTGFP